jgi:undecaprenyl-diphosphatase
MDFHVFKALNGFAFHHDAVEDPLRLFATQAQFVFVALLAILFLMRGRWRSLNARRGVVAAGFSTALALGAAQIVAHLWERPRPYAAHPDAAHLFIPASHDSSFPSDHATASFAIAMALFLRNRRIGTPALVLAAIVSVGRVAVGTHYPGDVLAGAALGSLTALLLWHPRLRAPIDAFADWCGALYDGIGDRVLRRPAAV